MKKAKLAVSGREARGFDVNAHDFGIFEGLRHGGEVGGVRNECVACEALFHEEILARCHGRDCKVKGMS